MVSNLKICLIVLGCSPRMAQVLQSVAARHNVAVRACPKRAHSVCGYIDRHPPPPPPSPPPPPAPPQVVIVNQMTTLVNAKRDSDSILACRRRWVRAFYHAPHACRDVQLHPPHHITGLSWEHAATVESGCRGRYRRHPRRLRAVRLTFYLLSINLHRPTASVLRSSSSRRRWCRGRRDFQVGSFRRLPCACESKPSSFAFLRSELARRTRQAAGLSGNTGWLPRKHVHITFIAFPRPGSWPYERCRVMRMRRPKSTLLAIYNHGCPN